MRARSGYRTALPLLLGTAALLSACTGGGDAAGVGSPAKAANAGDPEVADLVIAITPVVDHSAIYIGVEEGFFEEEGLQVTPEAMQGGAAAMPAMVAGDVQAISGSYPSFFIAESQGLGVTLVAEAVRGTEETGGIYVAADSPIAEPKDLEGATLAINTFKNVGDATIRATLAEQGVDLSKVQFVEMPFPDMPAALAMGNVDAIWVVEPFRTAVADSGARKLMAPYSGIAEGIPVSGVGVTDEFAAENPNTVAALTRALEKSNAYLAENPDAAREIVQTFAEISPEVAAAMELPKWNAGPLDVEEVGRWNDILASTELLPAPVDMGELVLEVG